MELSMQVLNALQVMGGIALGLPALISALIAFFMLVPGEQPEKFLKEWLLPKVQNAVDIIAKFSKK